MKITGEATVRVDAWGRLLYIALPLPVPLTKEEAARIHDKKAKVTLVVME